MKDLKDAHSRLFFDFPPKVGQIFDLILNEKWFLKMQNSNDKSKTS